MDPGDGLEKILAKPAGDKEFYFENAIFLVGNSLFQLPRNVFNVPGTIFEAMFAVPPTPQAEGSTAENPIVLNVDEKHFRGFLRIVCGSRAQEVTDDDWLGALEFATVWGFDDVREAAIEALDGWTKSQSLKSVVVTAKRYSVATWLKVAFSQLILQDTLQFDELIEPPSVDWETVARLFYAKETLRRSGFEGAGRCDNCGSGKLCCGYVAPFVVSKILKP